MVGSVARLRMRSLTRPWFCPLAGLVPALLVMIGGLPVAAQDPAAIQRNLEDGFWAILNSREFVFNH